MSAPRRPPARRKRPPPKGNRRTHRFGVWPQVVVLALVLALAGAMAIQPTRQLFAQRDRISEMSSDLKQVNESNRTLDSRIERLNDPDYLEQIARDSGYARPGETVYNVVPPSRKELKKLDQRRTPDEKPTPAPEPGFMERFLNFVGLG